MSLSKLTNIQNMQNTKLKIKFLIVNSKKNLKVPSYFSFWVEKLRKIEKEIMNSASV